MINGGAKVHKATHKGQTREQSEDRRSRRVLSETVSDGGVADAHTIFQEGPEHTNQST